jgi:protein-L-isoaspartate(D-aspartate) O-methyltransferase
MMTTDTRHEGPLRPDDAHAQQLRARLVAHLERSGELMTDRVKTALLKTPRHLFVPEDESVEDAYANRPLPIGYGQTISQPACVAWMTEALELTGTERVLEIGTGSGYQAAVLSQLAREVYSIEYFPPLASLAAARLSALGYANVRVRAGDGAQGWREHAPFDRVIATAAALEVPPAWLEQLADGGILVAPVGAAWDQRLVRMRKHGKDAPAENLGWVSFVPLLPEKG